ncbi:hypothetical protein [Pseudomonas glycinae]|uniref:hypothetical protein n=1 Tax=Pseudomonas glycinae TaxID=1785145 RepID=UPI00167E2708|nr:hypothetical protein [Pseudomonas glycinae]
MPDGGDCQQLDRGADHLVAALFNLTMLVDCLWELGAGFEHDDAVVAHGLHATDFGADFIDDFYLCMTGVADFLIQLIFCAADADVVDRAASNLTDRAVFFCMIQAQQKVVVAVVAALA